MRKLALLLVFSLLLCGATALRRGPEGEEEKCHGIPANAENASAQEGTFAKAVFWVIIALLVTGPPAGYILEKQCDPESTWYRPFERRIFKRNFPLYSAFCE